MMTIKEMIGFWLFLLPIISAITLMFWYDFSWKSKIKMIAIAQTMIAIMEIGVYLMS